MSSAPERVKFTDLAVVLRPSIKVQKSDYVPNGLLPVVDQGAGLIGGFTNEISARFPSPDPVIVFGDHTCRFKYVPFPFAAGADGTQVFCGRDGIDTRYLYFACLTLGLEHFGYQRHMKHLKVAKVPVWPLPTQQRIAAILSTYDDLIETNTRRIAILEEMARRLYEEWFVHFRFPAAGATTISDTRLLDLADVAYGKGLPAKQMIDDGKYPVYGAAKIIGRYSTFTESDRTIIAGCRGSVGKFTITEPKCFVTNNSFTFKPKAASDFFWLFFALTDRGLDDVVSGSAQPQITLASLSNVELPLPSAADRERFANLVRRWVEAMWNLHERNKNLRAQRDLLLPKLVSGEIDVSGAEAKLEAAE